MAKNKGVYAQGGRDPFAVLGSLIRMKISPILNSPYLEPGRYFRSDEHGLTEEIVDSRRPSTVQIPIARPHGRAKHERHDPAAQAWSSERLEENEFVNKIRTKVAGWRKAG